MWEYVFGLVVICISYLLIKSTKHNSRKAHEILSSYLLDKTLVNDEKARDQTVRCFEINISEDDIKYLHHRLDITRFPIPSFSSSKFTYGVRDDYMKNFVAYWRMNYNWKEQEKMMNRFNHFKTNIEGLDIHFIHEKPPNLPPNLELEALIITHGWPGSFVECLEAIKHFTEPQKYAANETDALAIVCPSIPGFGFSDNPEKEGFNALECARLFHKLMFRLGYKKYYLAGGDWGALISGSLALLYPSYVEGCYTTMPIFSPLSSHWIQGVLSCCVPSLFYSHQEIKRFFPVKDFIRIFLQESGYFHLQATKPDTVGFALSDSPVGLAAYILEKFSTWTDEKGRLSNSGLLDKYWTYDQLLNNIMIYWWNGNITSSMRFYKESLKVINEIKRLKIQVPSGFGWFPQEFFNSTKLWTKRNFTNLVHFTYMKAGGHFNMYQYPDAFAQDVRLFIRRAKQWSMERDASERKEVENIRSSHLDRYVKR